MDEDSVAKAGVFRNPWRYLAKLLEEFVNPTNLEMQLRSQHRAFVAARRLDKLSLESEQ